MVPNIAPPPASVEGNRTEGGGKNGDNHKDRLHIREDLSHPHALVRIANHGDRHGARSSIAEAPNKSGGDHQTERRRHRGGGNTHAVERNKSKQCALTTETIGQDSLARWLVFWLVWWLVWSGRSWAEGSSGVELGHVFGVVAEKVGEDFGGVLVWSGSASVLRAGRAHAHG